jgi:hypothetical protein
MKGNQAMRIRLSLGAIGLAAVIAGCVHEPPPPPPPPVTKDHPNSVMLHVGKSGSGYTCTFSGGDDGAGKIVVAHAEGDVNIHVDLDGPAGFAMHAPYFEGDDQEQLHGKTTDHGRKATIHDRNSGTLDAYYGIPVEDNGTSPATLFVCDPRIVNN